ncbi:immunoglobulin-like domain-containing protein [Schleiferilactobacillus harbinensis]|uniref:immunoglobulin-like domain-containing protein n=1 Tax=Schleiferilactobacillus harbinensis TaxID=304207 RepID=UPI0026717C71|nr:immunoglobulin-like domain-containing protein [Schleiferilactobacillus harbinensis]
MKNTTKYAGLVAAALLAVAPIAAPVATATIAQGNGTVQAATSTTPYFFVGNTKYTDGDAPKVLAQTYDTGTTGDDIITAVFAQAKKQLYTSPDVQAYFVNSNGNQTAVKFDPSEFDRGSYSLATLNTYAADFGKAGVHNIPFTVTNPETNEKATINVPVTILDKANAPYVTGTNKAFVNKGDSFDPTSGVGFYENVNDRTPLGTTAYSVDTSKLDLKTPGDYSITYTVKNAAGLTRTIKRDVTVMGDTVPTFSYRFGTNNTKTYKNGDTVALNDADTKALTFKTNISFTDLTAALKSFVGGNSNLTAGFTRYFQTADSKDYNQMTVDLTTNFNTTDAVRNVISSTASDASYNIPVVAQNASGDKVTVNIPVVIGTPNALTQTNKSQVVYIKSGVTAQLYSDKATTQAISGRTLSASSAWQSPAVVTDASGKVVAYNLGGNQYVKASDVETTPQDNVSYQVKTQTIYVGNKSGAQLYSDPTATKAISGRDNLAYASAWVSYKEVYNNGTLVAYNLGGDQYVKAEDVTTTKPSGDQGQAVSGVFTISVPNHPTWGTAFYNDSLQAKGILPAASKWRVFSIKTLSDGKQYYNLGGNQWIRADYGRLTK